MLTVGKKITIPQISELLPSSPMHGRYNAFVYINPTGRFEGEYISVEGDSGTFVITQVFADGIEIRRVQKKDISVSASKNTRPYYRRERW